MSAITDTIERYAVGGDEDVAICVLPNASVLVASREAKPLHALPGAVQRKLFARASEIATLAYEALQAHGTNILSFEAEHAHYLVVARTENDGLPITWKGNRASPQELQQVAGKLKDAMWTIGKRDVTELDHPVVTERAPEAIAPRAFVEPDMVAPGSAEGYGPDDVAAEMQGPPVEHGPREERDYRIRNLTRRR